MKAAVVQSFDAPPAYADFAEPTPGPGEELVTVRAAGLHLLVKAIAAGKHYSSDAPPPFIAGVDGVAHTASGRRVYFGRLKHPYGTMAERAAASGLAFELPAALSDAKCAAVMNPGMSSWLALVERAKLEKGETVLVIGATGASGALAVQVAKKLGAGRVLAAGRDREALEKLPADEVLLLDDLAKVGTREIGVVLDYIWGPPAEVTLNALRGRSRYVQIGSLAGDDVRVPARVLRSTGLTLMGSGIGSVPMAAFAREIPRFLEIAAGLDLEAVEVPLRDVAKVWNERTGTKRIVLVP